MIDSSIFCICRRRCAFLAPSDSFVVLVSIKARRGGTCGVSGAWQSGGVGGVWPRAGRLTSHPWRSHPTRPEATDNGQICARTSPQSLMSHPNLIWTHQMGNCTSCPQNGELAPDGGAGRPSPLTPSLKTPTNRLTVSPQFTTDMDVESRILKESV